jgi:uncharacterized protein YkwD
VKQLFPLLALVACSTAPSSTVRPPATPPPPLPPPTESAPNANAMLTAINAARGTARSCGGKNYPAVSAVKWSTKLEAAARAHSQDMRDRDYFAHEHPSGPKLATRLQSVGYTWSAYGENIAAGYASLNSVMTGWLNSPGHCSNIMSANFTEVGLALVSGGSKRTYWTMDLGKPR